MTTDEMLKDIVDRLERIEQRQIKTTKMVEAVEKEEQSQVQGSFASSDIPQEGDK